MANWNPPRTPNIPGTQTGWGSMAVWPAAPQTTAPTTPTVENTPTVTAEPEVPPADPHASALDYLRRFFSNIGINMDAELEGVLRNAMVAGYTPADLESGILMPDIQNTTAFKTRFPGYSQRISNGYNAISIAQYLQLEDSYRSIMANAGMPAGFYDDPADMGQWIARNVSPAEIESRVRLATDMAKAVDPTMRNLMAQFYGLTTGDVAAYFLDPNRALPTIEKQYQTAGVASWAARAGYQITDMNRYQDLLESGVTVEAAAQGYGTVATFDKTLGRLGSIYGESYNQSDAEQDVFFNNSEKRRRIIGLEAATFSGTSRGATGSAERSGY